MLGIARGYDRLAELQRRERARLIVACFDEPGMVGA
jgi:hypothetical protein